MLNQRYRSGLLNPNHLPPKMGKKGVFFGGGLFWAATLLNPTLLKGGHVSTNYDQHVENASKFQQLTLVQQVTNFSQCAYF